MKIRNYEQLNKIYFGIILLFILEIIGIVFIYHQKHFSYQLLSGIVVKKDYLLVMITKEERKNLYQNNTLYLKGIKKKYKIVKDHGKMLTKNKKDYYELTIKLSFSEKYKPNDVLELAVAEKKYRQIEIFKMILGGG